jgi:hypothetical protein
MKELGGCVGVQRLEALPLLFTQDADRVDNSIDARQPRRPPVASRHAGEVGPHHVRIRCRRPAQGAHDSMAALAQRVRDGAAYEARGTGEQDPHGGRRKEAV